MKNSIKKLLVTAFVVAMAMTPAIGAKASTKSDAEKMIKAYKAKKYSQAQKYANKLPKTQSKTCIKKLSKKAKAAYRKKMKSYNLDMSKGEYLWAAYLVDLTGDKKAELICKYGTCEADVRIDIYTYSGKLKKLVKESPSGHCSYYAYPGHTGMIAMWGHMGGESVSIMKIKKGKLQGTSIGSRMIDYANGADDWLNLPQLLENHVKYGYPTSTLDFTDLK